MVYERRKKFGKGSNLHGIATDSYVWHFNNLDEGRVRPTLSIIISLAMLIGRSGLKKYPAMGTQQNAGIGDYLNATQDDARLLHAFTRITRVH